MSGGGAPYCKALLLATWWQTEHCSSEFIWSSPGWVPSWASSPGKALLISSFSTGIYFNMSCPQHSCQSHILYRKWRRGFSSPDYTNW